MNKEDIEKLTPQDISEEEIKFVKHLCEKYNVDLKKINTFPQSPYSIIPCL